MMANELICHAIAKELGLPVPDSFPYRISGKPPVFLQLNFNGNGPLLPPVTAQQCDVAVAEEPVTTARIVVFDSLVMNTDRHGENLAFRSKKAGAPLLVIYDHGHALFGAGGLSLAKTKFKRIDWLGCDGNPPCRQCLLDHLQIENLGDETITSAVLNARAYGLSVHDAGLVSDALRRRKDKIRSIAGKNRKEFTGITQWPLEISP
jgi:hypothetical protein